MHFALTGSQTRMRNQHLNQVQENNKTEMNQVHTSAIFLAAS